MLAIIGETVDHITPDAAPDTRPKAANEDFFTGETSQNKQLGDQFDDKIETDIQAKGLTAPRVTLNELCANIAHTEIVTFTSASGQILRWAVLTTRNGFSVTGRPSCSASSANDNEEIGVEIAIENARSELWPLMGYALKERLAAAAS
jgi:hypothetical protein